MCNLLNVAPKVYDHWVRVFGENFAWYYTSADQWSYDYLVKTTAYWQWWNKQQELRDALFLQEMEAYQSTGCYATLFELWIDANAAAEIAGRPPKRALDESYQLMLVAVDKERNGELTNK